MNKPETVTDPITGVKLIFEQGPPAPDYMVQRRREIEAQMIAGMYLRDIGFVPEETTKKAG